MAVYVTSDAHGHLSALDRALELAGPGDADTVFVLGDMVDRGPDPVGVIRLVRSLPGARVLMGNHERMLLDVLLDTGEMDDFTWALNGGGTTLAGLDALERTAYRELIEWLEELALYDAVEVGGRVYLLVHAGIDAMEARGFLATAGVDCAGGRGAAAATHEQLLDMLGRQDPETLLWTRGGFWGEPTGLIGSGGAGPVVVAGHTPSIVLAAYADRPDRDGADADGRGRIVRVGACEATAGVADRIDIDCSAAAGAPRGRVGVMRLDDGAEWYAAIEEGA